jgi:hypothetical protein
MDKAEFLSRRLPTDTVDLNGSGVVTVRGLSRAEVTHLGKLAGDVDGADVYVLARGLVDPELSEDEVRQWRDNAPAAEVALVSDRIVELSGLGEGAQKSGGEGAGDG